ncbi:TspO/MBR family protein [Streptomyces hirsutus]|uniref:TspO/MBR family protein n=1 Tax=Streptomyces hirsutus TaxID=35620 RepID=UPI0034402218
MARRLGCALVVAVCGPLSSTVRGQPACGCALASFLPERGDAAGFLLHPCFCRCAGAFRFLAGGFEQVRVRIVECGVQVLEGDGVGFRAAAVVQNRCVELANDLLLSAWYRTLRKPSQPPPWAFGAVWTPLYATITYAAGHSLCRAGDARQRRRLAGSLAVNLGLNAGWNWLFFARRSPTAGLAGTLLLNLSNADLLHRTARVDRTAARALLPYVAWCCFATALNASITRLNR